MRCRICGCVTHWAPNDPLARRMGVNLGMAEPTLLDGARRRRLDGAVTERYLDH